MAIYWILLSDHTEPIKILNDLSNQNSHWPFQQMGFKVDNKTGCFWQTNSSQSNKRGNVTLYDSMPHRLWRWFITDISFSKISNIWQYVSLKLPPHPIRHINSLAPGRSGWNFRCVILKQILLTKTSLKRMPRDFTDMSPLVQVLAWCHQATRHYLKQCRPSSVPS